MSLLVPPDNFCELPQLPLQTRTPERLLVERGLEILEQQRVVQDLPVLSRRRRSCGCAQHSLSSYAAEEQTSGTGDCNLEDLAPRMGGDRLAVRFAFVPDPQRFHSSSEHDRRSYGIVARKSASVGRK